MSVESKAPFWRELAGMVALAVIYCGSARLGLLLAFEGTNASPVWPPTGIALGALCLWGLRLWPAVLLGAFVANLTSFLSVHPNLDASYGFASAGIALGNTGEALLGAWLIRRDAEFPHWFPSQRSVFRFVAIVLGVCLVSAGVGTFSLVASGIVPAAVAETVAWTWWLGDVCGGLLLAPALLAWAGGARLIGSRSSVLSALALAGWLVLVAYLVFGGAIAPPAQARPYVYLVFPLLAWAALRHGLRGATAVTLAIAGFAVWGTTRGDGPFAAGPLNDSLILLGSFLALFAVIALVLASDRTEQSREGLTLASARLGVHWLVLLAALAVMILGWHLVAGDTEEGARQRFQAMSRDLEWRIQDRLLDYERVLLGGVALFAASRSVEREEWREFMAVRTVQERLPGIQGLGYAARVAAVDRPSFVAAVRAEGYPEFSIAPAGEREEYAPVLYLEPFDNRNRRAFGYDLLTEPVRRAAMHLARDTGRAALTGKLVLRQELGPDVQAGVLLFLPVYRRGLPLETPASRRAALQGYVYAPFRAEDLIRGILGTDWPELYLEVFDGTGTAAPRRLYADAALALAGAGPAAYTLERELRLFERSWTLRFHASPQFEVGIDRQKAQLVFAAGALVCLLLFAMARTQALSGARAMLLAKDMTTALAASQARYRALYETSPAMLHSVDAQGRLLHVSDAWLSKLGYAREDALGRRVTDFLTPASREYVQASLYPEFQRTGVCEDVELQMECKDGRRIDVLFSALRERGEPGQPAQTLAYIEDITQRKAAERQLFEAQARQAAILNSAGVSIISTDPDGIILSFNPSAERMLGYRAEEVIGLCTPAILHDPGEVVAQARALSISLGFQVPAGFESFVARARLGQADEQEWSYIRKDGSRFPVSLSVTAIRDSEGAIVGFLGVAVDISERRAREALQKAALLEKETLLKEVYHRVKNNLQVISSLSNLQLRGLPEGQARDALQDNANRVHAMALVHEKLYQSSNLASIDIATYVHDLCAKLAAAMAADARGIRFELAVARLDIGLETSVPLGLLLNELIANSLKHAFPGEGPGTIHIALERDGEAWARLVVSDDGVGFPDTAVSGSATSLGLKLVANLSRQLSGQLLMENRGGAWTCLRFPLGAAD